MTDEVRDNVEMVERALSGTKAAYAALADTPAQRLRLAVEGRDPNGFTEVFAYDVVQVAAPLTDYPPRVRDTVAAAAKNLMGGMGKPLPDHLARSFVVAHSTRALNELLELVGA